MVQALQTSYTLYSIGATEFELLRSSLVSKIRELRGESWRARACKPTGSVEPRVVGITAMERIGWRVDKPQTHARAWKGSSLGF